LMTRSSVNFTLKCANSKNGASGLSETAYNPCSMEIEGHFPYFTKGFLLNNRKNPRRAKRAEKKNIN